MRHRTALLRYPALLLIMFLSVGEARTETEPELSDPIPIPIPTGRGRPPRPERAERESSAQPSPATNTVPSGTATVAALPWSGTRELRAIRVDRRGIVELTGNQSVTLAELAIPRPSRLNGLEGKIGLVALDYLQASLQNAYVNIELSSESIHTQKPPWPGYVFSNKGTLLLNAELLRLGLARHIAPATETVYSPILREAETKARTTQIGLWEQ